MADDYAGDITTTGVLQLGTAIEGEIEVVGDQDWFRVDLEAGSFYFFELVGTASNPYTLSYPDFSVRDEGGDFVVAANPGAADGNARANLYFTAETTGAHFIAAKRYVTAEFPLVGDPTGTYRLAAFELVPEASGSDDELGDGRGTAVTLLSDESLFARVDTGRDRDWYSFAVEAGKVYYAEMDHSVMASYHGRNSQVELFDAAGQSLSLSTRLDDLAVRAGLSFTTEASGLHYLTAGMSTSYPPGLYSLTLRELPSLFFTAGADWLTLPEDVLPRLLDIRGGAGRDMMSFAGLSVGIEVNLATGLARAAGAEAFSILMDGIENVTGTGLADIFHGSAAAELVRGLGGRDRFFGSGGADSLQGGGGVDLADYLGSASGVSVSLLRGRGWAGDAAGDRLAGIEDLRGSTHADMLWGDHAANRLEGGSGDDTITGNGGDDYILAGTGTDVIVFSGNRADYTIATSGIRTDVTDTMGPDGHDILAHAEVLRFADGDWLL